MATIALTEFEAGQRLDRYLRKLLPSVPLGAIFKHLRNGRIRVDGEKAAPGLRLRAGMTVALLLPDEDLRALPEGDPQPPEAAPRDRRSRPRVVHHDPDLLVISKPAGLAAQGSGRDDDVVAWLATQRFGTRTATFRPAPAHRLDRGTSGLVAIGLSPEGLRGLAAAFREGRARKVYLAVVHGVPEPRHGSIDAPLLVREHARAAEPKAVVAANGKPARTDYEVLEQGQRRALLRLVLHSGRLHQIRAHLAHAGHPIVGDARYGSTADVGRGAFLLHAAELALPHPRTGQLVDLRDPPPRAFRASLAVD